MIYDLRRKAETESQFATAPGGMGPQGRVTRAMYKTNPIWPGLGGSRAPEGERCKTNPIPVSLPAGGIPSIPVFYHSTIPVQYRLCETNPIPGGRGNPSFHYSIIPVFQSDADCAKRTQFPAVSGGMWPQGSGMRGNRAKRTQLAARLGGTGPQGRETRGKCAKRTQFAARPVARASLRLRSQGRLCPRSDSWAGCPCHCTAWRRHYEPGGGPE